MPIFRGVLGKIPSGPKSRVRNFIANKELGTQSDIHENVISPGVTIPWHYHETEEIIIVLEGSGECRTEANTESYSAGDVIILPAHVKHSLRNPGSGPIRQICVFPGDPATTFLEPDYPGQTVDVFNPSDWAKPNPQAHIARGGAASLMGAADVPSAGQSSDSQQGWADWRPACTWTTLRPASNGTFRAPPIGYRTVTATSLKSCYDATFEGPFAPLLAHFFRPPSLRRHS